MCCIYIVHARATERVLEICDLFICGTRCSCWASSSKVFLTRCQMRTGFACYGERARCALTRALLDKLVAPNCELRPLVRGPSPTKTELIRKEVLFFHTINQITAE